jgi:hypothetical protein
MPPEAAEDPDLGGPRPRGAPWLSRWRRSVFAGLSRVEGVLPVLMKPRNGMPWTQEDRDLLRRELRTAARWTPALMLFLLPGGVLLLPLWVWLLDRRRPRPVAAPSGAERRRTDPPEGPSPGAASGTAS